MTRLFVKSGYQLRAAELLHFDTKAQLMYIPLGRRSYIINFRKSLFGLSADVSLFVRMRPFFFQKKHLMCLNNPLALLGFVWLLSWNE